MHVIVPIDKFEAFSLNSDNALLYKLGIDVVELANMAIVYYRRNITYVDGVGIIGVPRQVHWQDMDGCLIDVMDEVRMRYIYNKKLDIEMSQLRVTLAISITLMYDTILPFLNQLIKSTDIRFIPDISRYNFNAVRAVDGGVILNCTTNSLCKNRWFTYAAKYLNPFTGRY